MVFMRIIFFSSIDFFAVPPPPVEELNALCTIAGSDVLTASLKDPCISKILAETRAVIFF
jgi:hypothetical protein